MSRTERTEINNKDGTVTITTKYIITKDGSSVAVVRTKGTASRGRVGHSDTSDRRSDRPAIDKQPVS